MVIRALSRKLLRDLWRTRSQGLAISLVIAAGVAMFVAYFSTFDSLRLAQRTYYDRFRFADVFVMLKRAPLGVADDLAAVPGIAQVTARVVVDVALDIPGMIEPATGRLISIPAREQPVLNEPFLRRGRRPEAPDEVMASEGFALAHGFVPGDSVAATINGRRRNLRIVGIALSPEYIYTIRPGEIVPDNARFGIFWMERRSLAAAFNMEGAFNDASFALMRGASEPEAMAAIDRVVAPYGSLGAVARRESAVQLVHRERADTAADDGCDHSGDFPQCVGLPAEYRPDAADRGAARADRRNQGAGLHEPRDRHALRVMGGGDCACRDGAWRARRHLARELDHYPL